MILAGLSDDEVYHWIDEARESGILRRFTMQRQIGEKALSIFNTRIPLHQSPI